MAERITSKTKASPPKAARPAPARTPAPSKTKSGKAAIKLAPPSKSTAKKDNTTQAAGSLQVAVERLEGRMAELKRERDALAQELAAARQQITALEAARTQAINRIDWVLDSLQSMTEDKS
jgi:septal ring factor EnvC (AmiA/AmiB activator)